MNSHIKNTRLIFLEAALYSAGRPLHFNSLKKAIKTKSDKVVIKLVEKLSEKTD